MHSRKIVSVHSFQITRRIEPAQLNARSMARRKYRHRSSFVSWTRALPGPFASPWKHMNKLAVNSEVPAGKPLPSNHTSPLGSTL